MSALVCELLILFFCLVLVRLVVELKSEQYFHCILDESQKEVSEDEFLALPFQSFRG